MRNWMGAVVAIALAACSSSSERVADVMPSRAPELAKTLEEDTGVTWLVTMNDELGTPSFVEPKTKGPVVLSPGANAEEAARGWLEKYAAFFGMKEPRRELELEGVRDGAGLTHVAFRQVTSGVRVDGTRVALHFDRAGSLAFVNSTFAPRARDVGTTAEVDARSADGAARAAFGQSVRAGTREPELLVDPRARILLWRVALSASAGASRIFDVDAVSGAIIASRGALAHARQTFSAPGSRGPYEIEIDVPAAGAPYQLARTTDGVTPGLRCADHRKRGEADSTFTSPDGVTWDSAPGDADQRAAVDGYANLALVERWYRTQLGHASFDGAGTQLWIWMHKAGEWNAGWDSAMREIIVYDGPALLNFKTFSPASSVDIMAHEFQHGVTSAMLGLVYEGQAGAVNESLSDVFGALVEQGTGWGDPHFIAESSLSVPLRSMVDPPSRVIDRGIDRMPDYEEGSDPHRGSGVGNKAFMLFTEGGTHAATSVEVSPPVGYARSRDVYWELVRGMSIGPRATYEELALAHVAIARQQGDDVMRSAACAWRAVEVLDDETTKSRWDVECAPHLSCLANRNPCGEGKRCEWNGQTTGYCCRTPRPGTDADLCVGDTDCPAGKVCSYGRDNLLYCQDPERGDDSCERPPAGR